MRLASTMRMILIQGIVVAGGKSPLHSNSPIAGRMSENADFAKPELTLAVDCEFHEFSGGLGANRNIRKFCPLALFIDLQNRTGFDLT